MQLIRKIAKEYGNNTVYPVTQKKPKIIIKENFVNEENKIEED